MTSQDTFKDRLLFTFFSAAATALVAYVARQAVARAWERVTGREAPHELGLMAPAGKKAGEGVAARLVQRVPIIAHLRP